VLVIATLSLITKLLSKTNNTCSSWLSEPSLQTDDSTPVGCWVLSSFAAVVPQDFQTAEFSTSAVPAVECENVVSKMSVHLESGAAATCGASDSETETVDVAVTGTEPA